MKKGLIKVTVLYPNAEGKHFDMDYYINKHPPLATKTLGDALKGASNDRGLRGGAPGSPATYLAIANLYFNSLEEFGQAFEASAPTFMGDLPNYTNIEPVIQINEVMA